MLWGVGAGCASLEIPLLVLLQLDSVRMGNVFLYERVADCMERACSSARGRYTVHARDVVPVVWQ